MLRNLLLAAFVFTAVGALAPGAFDGRSPSGDVPDHEAAD